jgi:SAM-dependent methyltransferase
MQVEASSAPDFEYVKAYYDERVAGKLRDFTHPNPRIEAAIQTLAEWSPANPKRILEIGCGIGATSWRMARAWPQAEVIGADLSPGSIEVAKTCFQRPNLSYRAGLIREGAFEGKFDLILLMDVYEHIAVSDRHAIHAAIKSFLLDESRVVITVPTPANIEFARIHDPSGLQPVDEYIEIDDIKRLAHETATDLLYYRKVGIWNYGDYAHVVLGRYRELADVARRAYRPEGWPGVKERIKGLLGRTQSVGLVDYLASDVAGPLRGKVVPLQVSRRERRRLAARWFQSAR